MVLPRRFISLCVAVLALAGLALFAAACGGDGEPTEAEIQEFEDTVRQLIESGPEDVDFFLEHVTDKILEEFFGYTRDECRDNADECVGEPGTLESLENTDISGDEATTDAQIDFGDFHISFVRQDDVWKLDGIEGISQDIPEGVPAVSLGVSEFTFALNAEDIPADGNFAFEVSNVGEQPHEVIVLRVPADLDIEEAIMSEGEPEGIEDIAFWGPVRPGNEGNVVFDAPLEPGRYALLCFLPDLDDPERTPHAFKGMLAEFTIE